MGATIVTTETTGCTAQDAFDEVCADCQQRYGDDDCDGTFSTTGLCKVHKTPYSEKPLTASAETAAKNLADEIESQICKGGTEAVVVGVDHWEVTTSKSVRVQAADHPKYETRWVVTDSGREEVSFPGTAAGREKALEYAASHMLVWVRQTRVLVSGTEEKWEVKRQIKTVKTEPRRMAAGTTARPVYKFVFIGMASC